MDNAASDALKRLLTPVKREWTDDEVSACVRFVMPLRHRHPKPVAEMKAMMAEAWQVALGELATTYPSLRRPNDPETYEEFLARQNPDADDRHGLGVVMQVIDSQMVGNKLLAMKWRTLDLYQSTVPLLLSDRPIQTTGLTGPTGSLLLPIGPRKLFIFENGDLWHTVPKKATATQVVKAHT